MAPEREKTTAKRLYGIWYKMNDRCYNQKNSNYRHYGGRGISVCEEWRKSNICGRSNFELWSLNNGYANHLSIDRIDYNGNYNPENCRWITQKEQSNNTRKNRIIHYHGCEYTVSQFCEKYNTNRNTIIERLNNNIPDDELLIYQKDNSYLMKSVLQYDKNGMLVGEFESITQCAKELGTLDVCISRVCNERRKTHRGYVFKFKEANN